MSFFAIMFALLLEQVRPVARDNPIHGMLRAWVRGSSRNFDAGKPQHGWLAWVLAVGVPSLVALGLHWLLVWALGWPCLLYTSPSPRDQRGSRMPSSA